MKSRRFAALAAAVAALFIAVLAEPGGSAWAATFNVTKETDTNDGACNADCSLREAVIAANATAGPDEVVVPPGSYALSVGTSGEDAAATGDLDVTKDLTITGAGAGSTIVNGGGIDRVLHLPGPSTPSVTVSGITVTGGDGKGEDGGGIRVESGNTLTVLSSTVSNNKAPTSGDDGGGIENRGTLTITDSTVTQNEAKDDGGGIVNRQLSSLALIRSTVSGNKATSGTGPGDAAGVLNIGNATITNSTISGNVAEDDGGGIYNDGTITITNSTIASNEAQMGGGIRFVHRPGINGASLKNTIVSGNAATVEVNCSGPAAAITSNGHNLESADTCSFNGPGDQKNTDPKLGPLGLNGGPTQTRALDASSPAIDAGDNSGCPATDQAGTPRPQGGICDIGAFEVPVPLPPALLLRDLTAPAITQAFANPKTWTVDRNGPAETQGTRKRRKAKKGTTLNYTLSEAARVVFTIEHASQGRRVGEKCKRKTRKNRKKRRCTRYSRAGSFAAQGGAGANRRRFSGKIGRKALRPARYRATLVATDGAGNRSKPRTLSFTVVR